MRHHTRRRLAWRLTRWWRTRRIAKHFSMLFQMFALLLNQLQFLLHHFDFVFNRCQLTFLKKQQNVFQYTVNLCTKSIFTNQLLSRCTALLQFTFQFCRTWSISFSTFRRTVFTLRWFHFVIKHLILFTNHSHLTLKTYQLFLKILYCLIFVDQICLQLVPKIV